MQLPHCMESVHYCCLGHYEQCVNSANTMDSVSVLSLSLESCR